ncbi:MAG: hypothetical protein Q7S40_07005 [Opitutaceae bacterium]|nr:hypothetical protein [Opitutaceae bacterium]
MTDRNRLLLRLIFAAIAFGFVNAAELEIKPELPKTGVNLARSTGGWLNVEVTGNHSFVVSFFDQEKKPIAADAVRGVVRFFYTARENKPPVPLHLSEDSKKLVSLAKVRPPHVFRVFLVLFGAGDLDIGETYNFRYPG